MTSVVSAPPARRSDDDYADVVAALRRLRHTPTDSVDYSRLRERIVGRCLPIADHIARRFAQRGEPEEDLQQVARMALIKAVDRFDAEVGDNFVSFAVPTIMGEVRRYFRDYAWSMRVPRRLKELHLSVGVARSDLAQRLNRAPTASELAHELGVEQSEVVQALIAANCYHAESLHRMVGGDDDAFLTIDTLGSVDGALEYVEDREALLPMIAALPVRDRTILQLRFFEDLTQTQIAERLGISQMHVSRRLAITLAQLRSKLVATE
jgi:RNA polymerase sigma-B factor